LNKPNNTKVPGGKFVLISQRNSKASLPAQADSRFSNEYHQLSAARLHSQQMADDGFSKQIPILLGSTRYYFLQSSCVFARNQKLT